MSATCYSASSFQPLSPGRGAGLWSEGGRGRRGLLVRQRYCYKLERPNFFAEKGVGGSGVCVFCLKSVSDEVELVLGAVFGCCCCAQ